MKIRRVGKYGPRCSLRFKDRLAEMLAPDYRSPMFGRVWEELRPQILANLTAPSIYAVTTNLTTKRSSPNRIDGTGR